MQEFPRMLYRPGHGPEVLWDELVDNRIVHSVAEQRAALREGWLLDPAIACKKAKGRRERRARWNRFAAHWQFWITTMIALASLIAAYLAIW